VERLNCVYGGIKKRRIAWIAHQRGQPPSTISRASSSAHMRVAGGEMRGRFEDALQVRMVDCVWPPFDQNVRSETSLSGIRDFPRIAQ